MYGLFNYTMSQLTAQLYCFEYRCQYYSIYLLGICCVYCIAYIYEIYAFPLQERLRRNQDGVNIGSDDEFILVGNNREQQQEV